MDYKRASKIDSKVIGEIFQPISHQLLEVEFRKINQQVSAQLITKILNTIYMSLFMLRPKREIIQSLKNSTSPNLYLF